MSAPKGIDIRQSGGTVLVRVGIDDASGNALAAGSASLRILEWQADGSLKQLDFADNTFKTGTLTTPTLAMAAWTLPDSTVSGLWSAVLSSGNVANFAVGGIYVAVVTHSALPGVTIRRECQYGSVEGDLALNSTGAVSVSMTQAIPLSNTAQTIGDALNAARAQGFGKWLFDPIAKTLKLFGPDGATAVRTFTVDSATNPTSRT